jgi:hypothetical protein
MKPLIVNFVNSKHQVRQSCLQQVHILNFQKLCSEPVDALYLRFALGIAICLYPKTQFFSHL